MSGDDLVREALDSVPTPPAEREAHRLAQAGRVRRPGRARAARGARPRPAGARRPCDAVRAPPLRRPRRRRASRSSSSGSQLDRERAVEGDDRHDHDRPPGAHAVERLELHVPLPDSFELVEGANAADATTRLGRGAHDRAEGSLHALGRVRRRRALPARARPARPLRVRGHARPADAAQGLPARRAAALARRAARDAGLHGQPGRAHEGRRHRVRRPAPLRVRRRAAPDQLARERAAQRAVGQRAASRAEHRRDRLPRHVRRGARGEGVDARRRRPRGGDARRPLPRSARTASA